MMITRNINLSDSEVSMQAVRAQGSGGQNVNKVASAIHLFFDIKSSSLPEQCKQILLEARDQRVTRKGVLVIKAGRYRTQEQNKSDAMKRLKEFIMGATIEQKPRKPTRPSRYVHQKRLENKTRLGRIKQLRKAVDPGE